METQQKFEKECLDAVKTLAKTLGSLSLYKVGHPAVAGALTTTAGLLAQALAQSPNGEIVISIDQDKIILHVADGI